MYFAFTFHTHTQKLCHKKVYFVATLLKSENTEKLTCAAHRTGIIKVCNGFFVLFCLWFGLLVYILLFDFACMEAILVHILVDIAPYSLHRIIIKTFKAIKNRVSHDTQIRCIQTIQYIVQIQIYIRI